MVPSSCAMKYACSLPMRTPFMGFQLTSNLVQRQEQRIHSLVRAALATGRSRPAYASNQSRGDTQFPRTYHRKFSNSSTSLARKRWVKSGPVADGADRRAGRTAQRTWQDYDPDVGMPLKSGELDQPTIEAIYGPGMDEASGNHVLRLMNYRRISGSLIDVGATFPRESGITQEVATKALDYLRKQDPDFNEQEAGAAWAEAEVYRVEQQYMDRAESLGLYKKSTDTSDIQPQGTDYGRDRYGDSALAGLRRANKARWMEEDRKKKELEDRQEAENLAKLRASGIEPEQQSPRKDTGNTKTSSSDSLSLHEPVAKAWLQPTERKSWVKYYEEQATIVKENKVPQLSLLRRLGPAALLALGVLGGCLTLHEMYAPPPKSARIFPDVPPAIATLGAITAINFAVFVAWRIPFLWRTMNKYFLVAPGYPFALGVFGAQFGHQSFIHLFTNTILLWPFGLMLHEDVGRGTFLAIYLGCGVTGAYGSLLYNVLRQRWLYYIFGSSTAVFGTMAATCLLRADNDVKILGYQVPMTGMTLLGLFGGLEVLTAWKGASISTDYAGHLTSMTAGIAAAWFIRRQAARREMKRAEYVPEVPVDSL